MASILKVGTKWRALVRRVGHKPICKTHSTKAAAEAWARRIEAQIDDGKPVAEERSTKGEMFAEIVRFAVATALRRGEIERLQWPTSTRRSAWCWCVIGRIRARRRATISGYHYSAKPGWC